MTSFDSSYLDNTIIPIQSQDNWIRKPYLPAENSDVRRNSSARSGRGLSLYKQKFICFYSAALKKLMWIDLYKARYHRMRQSIMNFAMIAKMRYFDGYRMVMLDLTYRRIGDWLPNDIDRFVKRLKQRLGENLMCYAWVAELQDRGAIHYHMIVIVKRGTNIPKLDKSGLWPHGCTRRATAETPYYMVTYVGKEYQKNFSEFQKGARCFGVGFFEAELRNRYRFECMKQWEKDYLTYQGDIYDLQIARGLRKQCTDWQICYVTDDYRMVQNVYDGYAKNEMISEENKWRSCQDGIQELKMDSS
jgi:hypothetical protein